MSIIGLMQLRRHLDRYCKAHTTSQTMDELCRIEYMLKNGGKPHTTDKKAYDVLQSCGIKTVQRDNSWVVG